MKRTAGRERTTKHWNQSNIVTDYINTVVHKGDLAPNWDPTLLLVVAINSAQAFEPFRTYTSNIYMVSAGVDRIFSYAREVRLR